MRRQNGFTLIELLVVMAIIGILSAVVLTSLNGARQKGRDARRISDIKQIQLAIDLYYDSTGSYPATICPTADCSTSVLVTNGYIQSLPRDPSGTFLKYNYTPYSTSPTGVCISYHLGASLESGSTHSSLQTDADIGPTPPAGLQICAGGPAADFSGADSGKCGSGDEGSACFDVRA